MGQANINPFSNIVHIMDAVATKTYVISVYKDNFTHDDTDTLFGLNNYQIFYSSNGKFFIDLLNYILLQLRIMLILVNLHSLTDLWILYLGDLQLLPALACKILGKKTILILGGSLENEINFKKNAQNILLLIKKFNLYLTDAIVIYSPKLIKQWKLERFEKKIFIAHEHYIDINLFRENTKLKDRQNIVGYIGRLSEEKGIINFIKATSDFLTPETDLKILIGGDGPLKKDLISYIDNDKTNSVFDYVGWIRHEELPDYLNKLRLLILPSYSEGLPNIMLEAMACGTPILASSVGAIPDIIISGENGFLMENNSPESIAINIIRILSRDDLSSITENAKCYIGAKFSYESTTIMWKNVLDNLN